MENSFIADIDALTYTSEAQTPAPVVTFHEMTLAAGTDYTVAYSNNTNAGIATVTCTGQGNYSGQAQKTTGDGIGVCHLHQIHTGTA